MIDILPNKVLQHQRSIVGLLNFGNLFYPEFIINETIRIITLRCFLKLKGQGGLTDLILK